MYGEIFRQTRKSRPFDHRGKRGNPRQAERELALDSGGKSTYDRMKEKSGNGIRSAVGKDDHMELLETYLPFWEQLSKPQKDLLNSGVHERHFSKGELLHNGSADCIGLLLVTSGQLRAYMVSEEGKELTLYRLLNRDLCLFSASCIMSSLQFDVMVSAEEETTALHIPSDVYKHLMEESLPVANYTNQLMASRFSDVMWLMDQIQNKKMDSRLAALLLEERELRGSDELAMTHEQLSNHLGSVREVVTRMLKYFQSEGLVHLGRGSIRILNEAGLLRLAGESLR